MLSINRKMRSPMSRSPQTESLHESQIYDMITRQCGPIARIGSRPGMRAAYADDVVVGLMERPVWIGSADPCLAL